VHDDKAGTLTLFALNRSLDEALPLRLDAGGFGKLGVKQALQLCDSDLKAVNTRDNPDRIAPKPLAAVRTNGQSVEASLAPASWNVIQLTV
jgi:alpha-L-arabinofuranosidase